MAFNKSSLRLLKAFGITLPLYVLTIGGSLLAMAVAPIIMNKRYLGDQVPRGDFPAMTLVLTDFSLPSSPMPYLISFSILFLMVWGILALPKKGHLQAGIAVGMLILALWVAVGFQTKDALTAPFLTLTSDSQSVEVLP